MLNKQCFQSHLTAFDIFQWSIFRMLLNNIFVPENERDHFKTPIQKQNFNRTYLITTLATKPTRSAFLFEKSEVNNVCVNFNPYSTQSNFRVAKK